MVSEHHIKWHRGQHWQWESHIALRANVVKMKAKWTKGSRSYSCPGFCAHSEQIIPFVHVIIVFHTLDICQFVELQDVKTKAWTGWGLFINYKWPLYSEKFMSCVIGESNFTVLANKALNSRNSIFFHYFPLS